VSRRSRSLRARLRPTTAEGEAAPKAPEPQDGPAPSWSSADDAALAYMLGRDPADEPATEEPAGPRSCRCRGRSPVRCPAEPAGRPPPSRRAARRQQHSRRRTPRAGRSLGDETPKPTTEAEKAEFRTTLRNWGIFALALVLVMSRPRPPIPTAPPPRRSSTRWAPARAPWSCRPRSTPKPTTEAEKAEFRTTLRNWGIFALALVLVMIIVASQTIFNEMGPGEGTMELPAEEYFITVESSGPWEFTAQSSRWRWSW
jgi:hypothetical protein